MSEIRDRIIDVNCEIRKLKRKLNELIDELRSISADVDKQDMNDILDYSEGYQKGLEDAWECSKKINCLAEDGEIHSNELTKIFGTFICADIVKGNSASEAIAKIKAYEEDKKKIRVGDEVEGLESYRRAFVIFPNGDNSQAGVIDANGRFAWWTKIAFRKTGRHFDEIEKLLDKMREKE